MFHAGSDIWSVNYQNPCYALDLSTPSMADISSTGVRPLYNMV